MFRGKLIAICFFPVVELKLIYMVIRGHLLLAVPAETRIRNILRKYHGRFPEKKFRDALEFLAFKTRPKGRPPEQQ